MFFAQINDGIPIGLDYQMEHDMDGKCRWNPVITITLKIFFTEIAMIQNFILDKDIKLK